MALSKFSARAMREITTKSEARIERETALKWAARSIACFQLAAQRLSRKMLQRGRDMHHEALEHGALVHDGGKLVGQLDAKLLKALSAAEHALAE